MTWWRRTKPARPSPSIEASDASAAADAAKQRIGQKVPGWNATVEQLQEARAANHFADMLDHVLYRIAAQSQRRQSP